MFTKVVPKKHDTRNQCWFNAGPASRSVADGGPTLNQHWFNVLAFSVNVSLFLLEIVWQMCKVLIYEVPK